MSPEEIEDYEDWEHCSCCGAEITDFGDEVDKFQSYFAEKYGYCDVDYVTDHTVCADCAIDIYEDELESLALITEN